MTDYGPDDELDRLLGAARPTTAADEGWAASAAGDEALTAILGLARRGGRGGRSTRGLRRLRPYALGIGFAAVAATVVGIGIVMPGPAAKHPTAVRGGPSQPVPGPRPAGAVPAHLELAAYDTCTGLLHGLRKQAAAHVTQWGLGPGGPIAYDYASGVAASMPGPAEKSTPGAVSSAPDHSTTNDQETGADEPDIVKTDGNRVVSVSGGVLRVVDVHTRKITGSLDLGAYAGADAAELLVSGDRALVLLGDQYVYRGVWGGGYAAGTNGSSTYLLVDLSGTPTVVSTLHTAGSYVDARLIGGVARVVVDSSPRINLPAGREGESAREQLAANRRVIKRAPLSAWLPRYSVSDGRTTSNHTVPCSQISHPASYTGASMVTVYTFDPAAGLADPRPISIAADGATVYATTADLYVASSDGRRTQLHRFYLSGRAAPTYLGSGSVPGWLLNSYSMSEYAGALRVVTSDPQGRSTTLYVLDADTLRRRGSVGGLGVGENLHAVRFLGPLAYVVTFESVDPLYVLDLHDADHPVKSGELEVTGYSDYLHPTDDGRLLGVGEDVNAERRVTGLQVSLFDVSRPSRPSRLARVVREHTPSENPLDPHAFVYWPTTRTAVIPIDSWQPSQSGAALVLHVGHDGLQVVGTIRNPGALTTDTYDSGIERTLVIGDELWTMSNSGLLISDLGSLDRHGWVAFS